MFDFIGSMFGYLLWSLYVIFKNYGVAIIIFSIVVKLATFPLTLKQQRSMASQSRMAAKQQEIQKRYANNRDKQNEELQKLYDKEGISPMSGCLTSLLPMLIMFGIYPSVISPLSNTLHISAENIQKATEYISKIPGVVSQGLYPQMEIIRKFDVLRDSMAQFFTAAEVERIDMFQKGFNFLGLDLLRTPQSAGILSTMILIPLLSLVVQFGTQIYMQRTNQNMQNAQSQQGCMKWMMYGLPLLSVYWAYSMPGAIGFYWVVSGLLGFLQSVIIHNYFSVHHMTAKQEAQRSVTLELGEAKLRPLPAEAQLQISNQLEAAAQIENSQPQKSKSQGKKQSNKRKSSGSSSDQYRGKKK